VAVLLITFLAPMISSFALKFGPPEFFAVYSAHFCSFCGLGARQAQDGYLDVARPVARRRRHGHGIRQLRMTFGSTDLLRGINFLVAVIGLFGISEILLTMEERLALRGHAAKISLRVVLSVWTDLPKYWATLLRSSFIGCWLGITGRVARSAASFMGYNLANAFQGSRKFRQGPYRRRFAPETAGTLGYAALLPMLALGIPVRHRGDPARRLDGMGSQSGPLLFVEHKDFVWGLMPRCISATSSVWCWC